MKLFTITQPGIDTSLPGWKEQVSRAIRARMFDLEGEDEDAWGLIDAPKNAKNYKSLITFEEDE